MIIDVWSDVVCPWCFIGKRRLDKAIATLPPGTPVTVRHRAFQLDPSIRATVPTSDMLAHKYGAGPDQVQAMQARVCSIADGEGLCYDLSGTLSGNTRDAHRLLLWSGERQGALLEAMYSRYFENSGGLFTHEDLADVARTVGLDEDAGQPAFLGDHVGGAGGGGDGVALLLGACDEGVHLGDAVRIAVEVPGHGLGVAFEQRIAVTVLGRLGFQVGPGGRDHRFRVGNTDRAQCAHFCGHTLGIHR